LSVGAAVLALETAAAEELVATAFAEGSASVATAVVEYRAVAETPAVED